MIRILIADEMRLTANLLASVLADEPDIEPVGVATSVEEALEQVDSCDLVLVNTNLPDRNALQLLQTLIKARPQLKMIVMGVPESEHIILRYIEVGAVGYVLKDETAEELVKNIRQAHQGAAIASSEVIALLMQRVTDLVALCDDNELAPGESVELSAREQEVLDLMGQGLDNKTIAERLVIEPGTVKNHVHNIFKKLNVKNRREAAAYLKVLRQNGTSQQIHG